MNINLTGRFIMNEVMIQVDGILNFISINIEIIGWVLGIAFSIMFILGVSNRVTVYETWGDLLMSTLWIPLPFIGFIIFSMIAPDNLNKEVFNVSELSISMWMVVGITGAISLYSFILNFITSIRTNGVLIGVLVGLFRIISGIIVFALSFFLIARIIEIFDSDDFSFGKMILMICIVGIFIWVLKKLINGEDVLLERATS